MEKRIELLIEILRQNGLDGFLVSSPQNIFYLTGLSQFIYAGDAYFLVTDKKSYLFTNPLYSDGVEDNTNFELRVVTRDDNLTTHLNDIVRHNSVERVGMEGDFVSHTFFMKLSEKLKAEAVPVSGVIEEMRVKKDRHELFSIQKACSLTDSAYTYVLNQIKKGVSEREIAFEIEMHIRKKGGDLAFPTIVAFGAHAATPHHENSDKRLEKADRLVLLDFGARVDGYTSDLSRTFFVDTPSNILSSTYESLLGIQTKTIAFSKDLKIGSKLSEIAKFCNRGLEEERLPPLPHSLGHGLGIDIHESPRIWEGSDDKLEEGIVFTIEPGVYVPGKIGMRIEDTVGVAQEKLKIFTKSSKDKVVISL